ncbi:MAG TPA: hypothetical protein VIB48_13275 [Acidimicrobiia bacterium]|jgi:hypothetical protein
MSISDADERRHAADTVDASWMEACTFDAFDHASGVGFLARVVVEPNRPAAEALWIAWVDGAAPSVATHGQVEAPPGDRDAFAVGGVTARIVEPLRRLALEVDAGGERADLAFVAITPCVDYAEGPPSPGIASGHFEQTGRLEGALTSGGRSLPFAALGQRGRSWGAWHWDGVREWHRITGFFDGDRSCNLLQVVDAHGGVGVSGYLYDGGSVQPVVRAERRSRETHGGGPDGFELRLELAGGTTLAMEAERWRDPVRLGDEAVTITETPLRIVGDDRSGVGIYELVTRHER